MKYTALLKTIPDNNIVEVKMNDGSIIKCKKIPLDTIDNMDIFLSGIKDGISFAGVGLNFIATCGSTPLFSAVGDASQYVKNSKGDFLSMTRGSNGKFNAQPGFQEAAYAKEGLKAATTAAKVIPWVAIAITVVEVGTKIVMKQQEIKANQIATYDKYREQSEEHVNNLWGVVNNYTVSMEDDSSRTADLVTINDAFKFSNNAFLALSKEANNSKTINDHLVYALKSALDLYSFSYLLKIMFSKIENAETIIDAANEDISNKNKVYDEIYDKCYEQYLKTNDKHGKVIAATQMKKETKRDVTYRVLADVATAGLAELVSFGSKKIGKKVKESDTLLIENLDKCKNANSPFTECIENAYAYINYKSAVLRDDKYLYYQVD